MTYGEITASPPAVPRGLTLYRFDSSRIRLFSVDSNAGSGLRYRAAAFSVGGGRALLIAVSLREVDQTLHRLLVVEELVGSGVVLALAVLGWVVIRLGMRPLERDRAGGGRDHARRPFAAGRPAKPAPGA